jgi:hypothetical protein
MKTYHYLAARYRRDSTVLAASAPAPRAGQSTPLPRRITDRPACNGLVVTPATFRRLSPTARHHRSTRTQSWRSLKWHRVEPGISVGPLGDDRRTTARGAFFETGRGLCREDSPLCTGLIQAGPQMGLLEFTRAICHTSRVVIPARAPTLRLRGAMRVECVTRRTAISRMLKFNRARSEA